MRRFPLVAAGAAALLCVLALPASAHEEINPSMPVTGKPTYFTLSAANEQKVDLVAVTVVAPSAAPFGEATRAPSGWTVDKSDTKITYKGGSLKPNDFENFGFETEGIDQPGTLDYKVTLQFADGKTDDVTVPVQAVAPDATTPTTATSATTVAGSATASSSSDSDSNGVAIAALVVAILALLVALLAIPFAGRRRGPAVDAGGSGTSGSASSSW
jgi:hypothetical protein